MSIQSCCNNNKIHVGLLLLYSFKNVNNCHYQLSEEKLKQWAAQKANKINTTCFTLTLLLKFFLLSGICNMFSHSKQSKKSFAANKSQGMFSKIFSFDLAWLLHQAD